MENQFDNDIDNPEEARAQTTPPMYNEVADALATPQRGQQNTSLAKPVDLELKPDDLYAKPNVPRIDDTTLLADAAQDRFRHPDRASSTPIHKLDPLVDRQQLIAVLHNPDTFKRLTPEEYKQINEDIYVFEARAKADGVPDAAVAETYKRAAFLLAVPAERTHIKNAKLLGQVAEDIVHQAAYPVIRQGFHKTCQVTALADPMFARHPDLAAAIIETCVLKGKWTDSDGKTIIIPERSFIPGKEESRDLPLDGQRRYATQILNSALANSETQRRNPPEFYSQETPINRNDTGERRRYADGKIVMDHQKQTYVDQYAQEQTRDITVAADGPLLGAKAVGRIWFRQTGEKKIVVSNSDVVGKDDNEAQFTTEAELRRVLSESHGHLPKAFVVDANNPFLGGDGWSRHQGRWHVICIQDYNEKTSIVKYTNQWTNKYDGSMSVSQLFSCSKAFPATASKK